MQKAEKNIEEVFKFEIANTVDQNAKCISQPIKNTIL